MLTSRDEGIFFVLSTVSTQHEKSDSPEVYIRYLPCNSTELGLYQYGEMVMQSTFHPNRWVGEEKY